MTEREALKLALEALECALSDDRPYIVQCKEAITAVKEALAQPEQKPVVWMYQDKSTHKVWIQKHMRDFVDHGQTYETPLYTSPPQRTWVGLTDEEQEEIALEVPMDAVCITEAKLKEKNT